MKVRAGRVLRVVRAARFWWVGTGEGGVGEEGCGKSSSPVPINHTFVSATLLNERGKSCRPFADEMQQIVTIPSPAVLLDFIC
jgi:hypothetical protein